MYKPGLTLNNLQRLKCSKIKSKLNLRFPSFFSLLLGTVSMPPTTISSTHFFYLPSKIQVFVHFFRFLLFSLCARLEQPSFFIVEMNTKSGLLARILLMCLYFKILENYMRLIPVYILFALHNSQWNIFPT